MNNHNITGKMMPIFILATLFILTISATIAAPTVEVSPETPKPKGTVTFTATISDIDNIQQVNIHVEECSSSICFIDDFNETMTDTSENTYTATITLRHDDAIYFKYELLYLTNDGWNKYPAGSDMAKVDLDLSGQSSGNDNDGSDTGSDTPGFEFVGLVISVIFISLIIYRRKR